MNEEQPEKNETAEWGAQEKKVPAIFRNLAFRVFLIIFAIVGILSTGCWLIVLGAL